MRDRYGRPGKGNDKGAVEGLVGFARRNFMVPLPRFASWEEFNLRLEEQCRSRQGDILRGHRETIGERLARDVAAMAAPPAAPFEACDQAPGQVSSQSLVRYRTNDYSVPVAYPPDFFDFIVIDECHRGGAQDESTWRKILEHFEPGV